MARPHEDLEALATEARQRGARGVEILEVRGEGLALSLRPRGAAERSRQTTATIAVRVWVDQLRAGMATGTPDQASDVLQAALTAAAAAAEDPHGGPARPPSTTPRGLGIDDPRHEQLTDDDRLEILQTNQRAAARDAGEAAAVGPFWYREHRETRRFLSSRGAGWSSRGTTYAAGGEVRLRGADALLTDGASARMFSTAACLPFGALLGRRAAALATPGPDLTGAVRVLLPPRVTAAVVSWLAPLFAHHRLEAGGTLLHRAPLGEPLFHRKLHLVDDGVAPGGLRTVPFDDRGIVPEPMALLRDGHVAGRYLDPESARALDLRPTGHVRGAGVAPTNLQLNNGTRSIHALLGEQDRVVFEVDALDTAGLDPVTGRVDVVVNGVLHDRQKPLGGRVGVRLTGDLVDALQRVVAISSDTDRVVDVDAPGLFLDGLSIA